MKRCALQGKRKFRDAGEAARYVRPGEHFGHPPHPHEGGRMTTIALGSEEAVAHVRHLRAEMLQAREDTPGMAATDAYIRYMRVAGELGLNPTTLRQHSRDEVERFFAQTVPGPDGHVYWTGPDKLIFRRNDGSTRVPARWWWEHLHGQIGTTTMRVNPTCGDQACINPEHAACVHFRPQRYRDDQILGALQVFAMRHGHTPTSTEWYEHGGNPTREIIRQRFGGWRKAIAAAGLAPAVYERARSSPEDCVNSILTAKRLLGRWPTSNDYKRNPQLREGLREAGVPSSIFPLYKRLGKTWGEILRRAGKR